ncbi:hypothetical protein EYR36_011900 [Pleurotus pulmonarius]|nr:hypothetical protein EYR36_011900 [Pleurotus pulmonarius]
MSDILSSTPSLASPLIFGMEIGIPLFAIAIAQAVTYYRSYPNDPTHNKVFVGILLSIDLAHVLTIAHASFAWYLQDRLAERMPWSLLASGFFAVARNSASGGLINSLLQSVWPSRLVLWVDLVRVIRCILTSLKITVVAPFSFHAKVSASVIQCVSGMAMNTVLLTDTSVHSMHSTAGETLGGIQLATSLLCDVLITGSLVYFLRQGRSSGFSSTKNVIDTLVLYSINIGLVTRYQPTFTSPGKKLTELYI